MEEFVLTSGSARAIAEDRFYEDPSEEILPPTNKPRVTMQVFELARLKYGIDDNNTDFSKEVEPLVSCAPYRLILSDGQHLAPAKFWPERFHEDRLKFHKLVESGELKKGSIINFQPNSYTANGEGIATIFDMNILGHKSTQIIIGNSDGDDHDLNQQKEQLQPCHEGVMSFSPSNAHHCTVPFDYNSAQEDPLPRPILRLANVIKAECGYCAIAGGAPTAKYLFDLPGCPHCYETKYSPAIAKICAQRSSGDVDLFVPQFPRNLDRFYGTGWIDQEQLDREFHDFFRDYLPRVFQELSDVYGLRHTDLVREKIKLSGIEEGGQDYGWMRIFVGLMEKIEFKLVTSTGQVLDKPIQILVMNVVPKSQEQSWSDVVVSAFDADIIKSVAVIDGNARVNEITFSSDGDEDLLLAEEISSHDCLLSGKFHYIMRPCHSFPRMLERLVKYKKRGFELASFEFDERVSEEWKAHILLQFHRKYAYHWIHEMTTTLNDAETSINFPRHLVEQLIMPFLLENPKRPEEEQRVEIREMLRNMVRAELRRNGGFDPGLQVVDLQDLERRWSISDAREQGNDEEVDRLQEEHLQALMQVDEEQAQRGGGLPDEDMIE